MKFMLLVLILSLSGELRAQQNQGAEPVLRVASFNTYLNRPEEGQLVTDLASADDQMGEGGADRQVRAVAEIIQRVRPDVILLNEFDYDSEGKALRYLQENFLNVSQNNQPPVAYAYTFLAASNTGVDSGLDLDGDGEPGGPGDAFGFGFFPGQYGMAVLSKYPILENQVRTFRQLLWRDMPGALLPDNPATKAPGDFYSAQQLAVFRLSSKSHWDVPVQVGETIVHVLAAHPTPPVFDGPEDRNGARNHDEIRFWADYIGSPEAAAYISDDEGKRGGLGRHRFVVLGDYNADPIDGDSLPRAIHQLLDHPAINAEVVPASAGAQQDAEDEGMANQAHQGAARFDTADLNPQGPGNLRIDYVLPSRFGLLPVGAGVFWPGPDQEGRYLVGDGYPVVSSDHRLVWLDLRIVDAVVGSTVRDQPEG